MAIQDCTLDIFDKTTLLSNLAENTQLSRDVIAWGNHHQAHHWMLAKGGNPH